MLSMMTSSQKQPEADNTGTQLITNSDSPCTPVTLTCDNNFVCVTLTKLLPHVKMLCDLNVKRDFTMAGPKVPLQQARSILPDGSRKSSLKVVMGSISALARKGPQVSTTARHSMK